MPDFKSAIGLLETLTLAATGLAPALAAAGVGSSVITGLAVVQGVTAAVKDVQAALEAHDAMDKETDVAKINAMLDTLLAEDNALGALVDQT